VLAASLTTVSVSAAQPTVVPSPPEDYLGFRPGEDYRVVDWGQATRYLEIVAGESPRIQLDTIGRSTLDRPMVLLTVSDPANLERLDELRDMQARLADPRRIADELERSSLIRDGRLVVLVTAAIHPTEVGASMLPLNLAYRLAAATDSSTLRVLRECVILIVPAVNPDGVDAVAEWYRTSLDTPWEGVEPPFLYHHYTGHDINRDWYALTQAETRNVVTQVHNAWHPQIVHEIHQHGSTASRFFIPPWLDPIEPNVDPMLVAATNALGTAIAWDMQREGKTGVVVHSGYDAWSPSRAFQHYHGGVRILSETASARLASPVEILPQELRATDGDGTGGRSWNQPAPWTGGRWAVADILEYMESGAMALLRRSAADRVAWLESFVTVGERAVAGWSEWPEAWVIPAGQPNVAGVAELLRIFRTAQVEVHVARSELRAGRDSFPAGSFVVDMHQPYGSFAQAMLDPEAYPGEMEYPGGPPREPYDVTAHNLPLLLGFRAVALERAPEGDLEMLRELAPAPRMRHPGVSGKSGLLVGLYQSRVPSSDEGWTRWLLDRYEVPYQTLHDHEIKQGELVDRFTAIVLPSIDAETLEEGWSPGTMPVQYTGGLGTEGARALRQFVEQGGTLVALGASSAYAADRLRLAVTDRLHGQVPEVFYAPGAMVTLHVDTTTAVGAGMPPETAGWIQGGHAFDLPAGSEGIRVASFGTRPLLLSGWVNGIPLLAGAAAVVELKLGLGRVVLFGIRPQYRGQSLATFPLLFNALRRRP
jgi:hypothetical protein